MEAEELLHVLYKPKNKNLGGLGMRLALTHRVPFLNLSCEEVNREVKKHNQKKRGQYLSFTAEENKAKIARYATTNAVRAL